MRGLFSKMMNQIGDAAGEIARLRSEIERYQAVTTEQHDENEKLIKALQEVANRAGNFMDVDAGDWMPSIYKIACEAIGVDPMPLLKAHQKNITVTFKNQENNDAGR